MSKFTPWTRKQAEQWAEEHTESKSLSEAWYVMEVMHASFLAGLAKAAEMIEACPSAYFDFEMETRYSGPEFADIKVKLVCPQPIQKEEPSDDQA